MKIANRFLTSSCLALALGIASGASAAEITVTDADIVGTVNWTADNQYILDGFVYVETNEVLNIEAGTVIYGKEGTGAGASALVVARGGKIYAEGTPDKPIVFTVGMLDGSNEVDPGFSDPFTPFNSITTPRPSGQTDDRWGGIVLLGNAPLNSFDNDAGGGANPDGSVYMLYEGLTDAALGEHSGENLHRGGGNDANDSSGVLRHVSIRHAGTQLAPSQELNSLSMVGIGRGTIIEYVEAFEGADDGFEFWGGTVNTRYLAAVYCEDESFDTDLGYSGQNQFWFALQKTEGGDLLSENDGDNNDGGTYDPATYEVYNFTVIGRGDTDQGIRFRERTEAKWRNGILMNVNQGLRVETDQAGVAGVQNVFEGNFVFGVSDPATATGDALLTTAAMNQVGVDPGLRNVAYGQFNDLDPRPLPGGAAANPANVVKGAPADHPFYVETDYVGAFASNDLWLARWSACDHMQLITPNGGIAVNSFDFAGLGYTQMTDRIQVTDSDIVGTVNWYRTNTYVLNGFVYVETNEVLNIESGTVVMGKEGTGAGASALVVARGGKLYADGTKNNPIIFTFIDDTIAASTTDNSAGDNPRNPYDMTVPRPGGQTTDRWGGIVLLGNAPLNSFDNDAGGGANPDGSVYMLYEGLTDAALGEHSGQNLHRGGGGDPDDSSGILRHASIRHAGTQLAPSQELNSLSMVGVGRGTILEYVEAYEGADDGFEFWGGTVNTKHLAAIFCEDESFDTDLGYSGKNQFWFALQKTEGGDLLSENDGDNNDGGTYDPATYEVYNFTAIGRGQGVDQGLRFRERTEAKWFNGLLMNVDTALRVETDQAGIAGLDNLFQWNFVFGVNTAATTTGLPMVDSGQNNTIGTDPMLRNHVAPAFFAGIDPRPAAGSPLLDLANVHNPPADGFYCPVGYVGAFGARNWLASWSAVHQDCVLSGSGGGAPEIVSQPVNTTAGIGDSVTLTAGVRGSGLTYAWYKDGVALGVTTAELTLGSLAASDAGAYTVVVSNALGMIQSVNVTVGTAELATYAGTTVTGPVGAKYRVDYADNVEGPYMELTTITIPGTGSMLVIDPTPTQDSGKRFYRAIPID